MHFYNLFAFSSHVLVGVPEELWAHVAMGAVLVNQSVTFWGYPTLTIPTDIYVTGVTVTHQSLYRAVEASYRYWQLGHIYLVSS